jgi:hypothetical protein
MYLHLGHEMPHGGLGDYQLFTSARQVLSAERPVWEVLAVAAGGVVLLIAAASAVTKHAKKARKAVGL